MATARANSDRPLEVADRVRAASLSLVRMLRQLGVYRKPDLFRIFVAKSEDSDAEHMRDMLGACWRASQQVLELSEYFAAGYLEICKAAQTFRGPSLWAGSEWSLDDPSHHVAAAVWALNCVGSIGSVIDPTHEFGWDWRSFEKIPREEFFERWRARIDEVVATVEGFDEVTGEALVFLALERIQTLLICDRVPSGSFRNDIVAQQEARLFPPATAFSPPISPKELKKRFKRSWDSLKPLLDSQQIRNLKLSTKLYRISLDDLPPV